MSGNIFADLPVEIVENVALYLEPAEVLELRRTCTKLYNKTSGLCSRLFFQTLTTNSSRQDLTWLANEFIANRQLASGVQLLRFKTTKDAVGLGREYYWNRRNAGKNLVLPLEAFGTLRALLEKYLIQCRSFEIHVEGDTDPPDDRLEPADILQLLFLVAAATGLHFESIEISTPPSRHGANGSKNSKGTHLNPERLPTSTLHDPNVLNMLANLKQVSINLVYPDELISSDWLPAVFASFKNLRVLSLDLDLSWGDLELTQHLLTRIQCPLLEKLELRRFKSTIDALAEILRPCSTTLRTLCLASVTLVVTMAELDSTASEDDGSSPWISWIRALAHVLPHLTFIELDLLNTMHPDRSRSHVHFSDLPDLESLLRQTTVEVQSDTDAIRRPRNRKFEYTVSESDPALRFELTSHNWTQGDRFVLPGMRYEGDDMGTALEFVGEWAREMSMF
jgi:hypothetical protein